VNAYLDIAMTVLRTAKRPLSSHAILAFAHRAGLVPENLYGKTQHKTLGARIAEDIVKHRDTSRFFRTAPGRYFLREFLRDETLPAEYREPRTVRRRIRELARGPALAITEGALRDVISTDTNVIAATKILNLLRKQRHAYCNPKDAGSAVLIRSFVCVFRGSKILSYRLGRYRDDRDPFLHKRSIGFSTLVHIDAHTLFNVGDMGIVEAGVRAVKIDLDIPPVPAKAVESTDEALLRRFVWVSHPAGDGDLLAIVSYRCPRWFEPVKRRLALNDLEWIDANGVNNIDDYEPWSRCVLEAHHSAKVLSSARRD
jgi:hypothetical protein